MRHWLSQAASSEGRPLPRGVRAAFEVAYGQPFGDVRVHDGRRAAEAAAAVGARAFTYGRDVAFARDAYRPETAHGLMLIGHELSHVAQQRGAAGAPPGDVELAPASLETDAHGAVEAILAGRRPAVTRAARLQLARFGDDTHFVIDEVALRRAGFSPEQIKELEKGNVQRDYSQLPPAANAALLGKASNFGGYRPEHHFDNFEYGEKGWQSRGPGGAELPAGAAKGATPIDYILGEVRAFAATVGRPGALVHLGNAFHTIEDFFAHSNFRLLIRGDERFGRKLVTGSFDAADEEASLKTTLAETAPDSDAAARYRDEAEKARAKTPPTSHSRLAADHPSAAGFRDARRLAALVVADIGRAINDAVAGARDAAGLVTDVVAVVAAKVKRYLAPPDLKGDRWWESLASAAPDIDESLDEVQRRTMATVRQAPWSPLKVMEASRGSPVRLGVGLAFPLPFGPDRASVSVGAGVVTNGSGDNKEGSAFVGGQVVVPFP
jgi:hypothetical protein